MVAWLWLALYAPYIRSGGFLRDDLGFLTQQRGGARYLGWLDEPRGFANYPEFQQFVSTFPTMTGRPVSALVHGALYWALGSTIWPYHLINLTLFLASILLVYAAIRVVLSDALAFLTSAFALVYPSAAGTVFSSIMMNSNLAAAFWSTAFYLDATARGRSRWGQVASSVLLLLSALSYEAFIPLFVVNVLVRIARLSQGRGSGTRRLMAGCVPAAISLLLFAIYRGFVEKLIFEDAPARIMVPSSKALVSKVIEVLGLAAKASFTHAIKIAIASLPNLELLSVPAAIILSVSAAALSWHIYRSIRSPHRVWSRSGWFGKPRWPALGLVLLAVALFVLANAMFVFSGYAPDSSGFDSRTQGAIRFAVAFLIATVAKLAYDCFSQRYLKAWVTAAVISLFALFGVSILGQREAWVAAAKYNGELLARMDQAIRRSNLHTQPAFTLIAQLPETFPHAVNEEPIFGETWDIGPALSLLYPTINVRANVYEPVGTSVLPDGVILHGYWRASYPFYLYRFVDDQIYTVRTPDEWRMAAPAAHTQPDLNLREPGIGELAN